ncbi:beta-lactamase-like protein, partial [Lipomyces tetrasporus]
VDYFKEQPKTLPPKACFLSHVHSDHLQGLENYIGPVVYCSPATKRLLLRLEKKSARLARLCNEVEIEPQRMYRNLGPENGRDVLRAIPYNTPTVIDLDPCQKITVTLFDANHCPGSTMFLIESDRKAILYTGDVRAENRWLEGLRQNPILIAYTRGWKKLDCIYLDTTFCGPCSSYAIFPSKAEGTDLLIDAVSKYPADTVFHFNAWTYGYEDLWIALASAFNTKIHVDKYRYDIFQSIGNAAVYDYGPCLTGYGIASIDNRDKIVLSEGCLALDPTCTRFHSCERGYVCDGRRSRQVVYIHPSVSSQIREPGAGYPRDGLDDKSSEQSAKQEVNTEDDNAIGPDTPGLSDSLEIITEHPILSTTGEKLPSFIEVPYSRHSSYTECCNLVALFQPMEVFPC